MHLTRHGLKDRRKANTADRSQRVLAAEFLGVEATFTATQREPSAVHHEYVKPTRCWARNKETIDCLSPSSAWHCRDLCLWISEPLEKLAKLSSIPTGTNNKSKSRAQAIRWNNLRERKWACSPVYTGPSTKAPWTTPKDVTNAQNNEE